MRGTKRLIACFATVLALLAVAAAPTHAAVIIDLWGGTPGSASTVNGRITGTITGTTSGGTSNVWGQDIRASSGNWWFNQQAAPSANPWRSVGSTGGTDPGHSLGNASSFIDSSVTLPAGTGDIDLGTQIGVYPSAAGLFRVWKSTPGAFTHEWDGATTFTFDGRTLSALVSDGDTWTRTFDLGTGNIGLTVNYTDAPPTAGIPEPTSLAIFGIGALGMVVRRRRKRKRTA